MCGEPYTHGSLDGLLRSVLSQLYGGVAKCFTWHSFRSGLATHLHAAGVSDAQIMLMCRWMSVDSLHVYRRLGAAEHAALFKRATQHNTPQRNAAREDPQDTTPRGLAIWHSSRGANPACAKSR